MKKSTKAKMSVEHLPVDVEEFGRSVEAETKRFNARIENQSQRVALHLPTVIRARRAFIREIKAIEPGVFDDLKGLIPDHREAALQIEGQAWDDVLGLAQAFPNIRALLDALKAWTEKYKLDSSEDDWFLAYALNYLVGWTLRPAGDFIQGLDLLEPSKTAAISANQQTLEWQPEIFQFRELWDPESEPEANFRQRVRTIFTQKLNTYIESTARLSEATAAYPAFEPQGLKKATIPMVTWLVLYLVRGLTFEEVADFVPAKKGGKPTDAAEIGKGVRRFARLIRVTLRTKKTSERDS